MNETHISNITDELNINISQVRAVSELLEEGATIPFVARYRKGTTHEEVWLIIERRKKDEEQYELRYFFSNMPQDMPTLEMVRLFHERFWIEQGYQQLKEELGLDHHEGRSWTGWRRHVLLVILAFGYLTLQRIQEKKRVQQTLWYQRMGMTQTSLSQ